MKFLVLFMTGVKAKELLIWLTLTEIYVNDPPTGKITFKTPTGLSRTFPVGAFEVEEPPSKNAEEAVKEATSMFKVAEAQEVKGPNGPVKVAGAQEVKEV